MTEAREEVSRPNHLGTKDWSTPELRQVTPARRTRGGSGEANGDIDGIIYDLS